MISVIIPAYNAAATLGACLVALNNQLFDEPYEVVVVDDGSTDDTAAIARAHNATVIQTTRNRPAAARNAGFRAAQGHIVCCTDADCEPVPTWLAEITRPFVEPTLTASKGVYLTRQTEWVARFVQLEYEDKYDRLASQETIDFIDTYSAAYRRDIILAAGGFDPRFDYLEDQELSFRLATRQERMVFQPAAVVYHRHAETLIAYMRKKFLIGYWKVQVVRRFPARVVNDSHTPQVMKLQMALVALGLVAVASWLIGTLSGGGVVMRQVGLWAAVMSLALFLATTTPFVRKAWAKDRWVALLSPFLLAARALSLGLGTAWGIVAPPDNLSRSEVSPPGEGAASSDV